MDNEQPHQELVKCVLVGDTAVGKTRLICARACNKHVSLSQLLSTHIPTVWAIDQYRIYKDVLERSWEMIDGVNVSLRLWDTFGDHEKDRRFAYGRSDVVLLCFSITNPISLRNCAAMWFPEIRRFCPETPVILVGCKNDLRYMYRDETYLSYFGDRSPFVRATRKSDLVMPDEARAVARDLGIYYYESSVFTYFGINEVFENAIRAALLARRQQRFWMTNLKRVQRPHLQAPFRPPKPPPPEVAIIPGTHAKDLTAMHNAQLYTDLVLVASQQRFHCHRFMLAAGSATFYRLLNIDFADMGARSSSESSMVSSTFGDTANSATDFNEDTECLIRTVPAPATSAPPSSSAAAAEHHQHSHSHSHHKHHHHHQGSGASSAKAPSSKMWEQLKRRNSYQALPNVEHKLETDVFRDLHHPVFQSIRIIQMESGRSRYPQTQSIVTMSKLITPQAMQQCLKFIYTGSIDPNSHNMQEVRQAAELLELPQFVSIPSTQPCNTDHYSTEIKANLQKYFVNQNLFHDVTFELDDGRVKAHRAILVARCDVMRAMLCGDFREAHSNVISLPGVTEYTFHKLLCYLYTDEIPAILAEKCLNLLELANRLCLPRLLSLIECRVIEDLTHLAQAECCDAVQQCLRLLEAVKLHNAHQLAEWCMSYLCVNYNIICKVSPKSLKSLHPDNQEYLREHRWPPVWYLKDYDYYQRSTNDAQRSATQARKDSGASDDCCLCFTGGGSKSKPTATDAVVQAAIAGSAPGAGNLYTPDSLNRLHSLPNLMNQLNMENNAADDDLYL